MLFSIMKTFYLVSIFKTNLKKLEVKAIETINPKP